MKDNIIKTIARLNLSILLCACIGSTALLFAAIYFSYPTLTIKNSISDKLAIIKQSEIVAVETEKYSAKIKYCTLNKNCSINESMQLTEQLIRDIDRLIDLAGTEEKFLSLVGNTSYDLLRVILKKRLHTNDMTSAASDIEQELVSIKSTHERLLNNTNIEVAHKRQERITTLYLSTVLTTALYLLALYSLYLKLTIIKENTYEVNQVLENTASTINAWDIDEFNRKLSDTGLNAMERRAYSKINSMLKELETHRNQMDLYRSLYSMIGFEIRGIAHAIKGGLKVLTKDTDEHGAFLAREITTATETLEELAENFNRLLSIGENSGSPIIDINTLSGNLATALSGKIRDQGGTMESYTDPSIPPVVFGNQIGLFWVLLLNFSNAIQRNREKNVLLSVSYASSKDIDSVSIFYDFIFIGNSKPDLKDITEKDWVNSEELKVSSKVSLNLLSGSSNHSLQWEEKGGLKRLRFSMDVIPKEYANNDKPLEGKNILMCGQSTLQVDIIKDTISHYGVTLEQAKTPNDIFKSISRANEFDAFLITDTIPGIEIHSFCKTLKSRLSKSNAVTKLLVSVADPETITNALDHVDHIFYRPIDNKTLISKLKQTLDKTGDKSLAVENNILIVEDDAIQQILLSQLINEFGISTRTADTGEEAIESLIDSTPDIIFMDCIMPGMGGIEATRQIRKNEQEKNHMPVTIIGATALTGSKDKKECIDAGMDYVISKPYNDDEIFKIIKNYLAAQKIN